MQYQADDQQHIVYSMVHTREKMVLEMVFLLYTLCGFGDCITSWIHDDSLSILFCICLLLLHCHLLLPPRLPKIYMWMQVICSQSLTQEVCACVLRGIFWRTCAAVHTCPQAHMCLHMCQWMCLCTSRSIAYLSVFSCTLVCFHLQYILSYWKLWGVGVALSVQIPTSFNEVSWWHFRR